MDEDKRWKSRRWNEETFCSAEFRIFPSWYLLLTIQVKTNATNKRLDTWSLPLDNLGVFLTSSAYFEGPLCLMKSLNLNNYTSASNSQSFVPKRRFHKLNSRTPNFWSFMLIWVKSIINCPPKRYSHWTWCRGTFLALAHWIEIKSGRIWVISGDS